MAASLDPDEVHALMSAIQEGTAATAQAPEEAPKAVPYDLTSQDRIIRGQMPTLDSIDDRVASIFEIGLSGRTRMSLHVTAQPATLMKFVDFNVLLAPPSTVCVLTLGAGYGQAVVVFEPGLAEALLAAALGDRQARVEQPAAGSRHELTSVERLVLKRLLQIFTDGMASAWAPILPFKPEVARFESDPRLAAIAPPNEVAILCSFEIEGPVQGRFDLAIPWASVEPARKALSSPPRLGGGADERFSNALVRELHEVEVEIRALLGKAQLGLSRLLKLQVGDVITLDTFEGSALPILVEGVRKLTGKPSVSGSSLAMVIERDLRGATPQTVPLKPRPVEEREAG